MPNVNMDQARTDLSAFFDVFNRAASIDGVEVFVHRKMANDQANGWRRLNTSGSFRQNYARTLHGQFVTQYQEKELVSYEYDAVIDENLGVATLAVFPALGGFSDELPPRNLEMFFTAPPSEYKKYNTRAVALYNEEADETAYLISRRSSFELLKNKFLARHNLGNNEFTPLTSDIVSFGFSVDFIFWRNTYFVDNDYPFQSITGFDELMTEKSVEALDRIDQIDGVDIENMNELRDCVSRYAGFRRKLAASFSSGAFDRFNAKRAVEVIDARQPPVEYTEDGDAVSFNFDLSTQASRKKVIDLLGDNYVTGEATGISYLSSKKQPV